MGVLHVTSITCGIALRSTWSTPGVVVVRNMALRAYGLTKELNNGQENSQQGRHSAREGWG